MAAAQNGTGMLAVIPAPDADQAYVQMFLFQRSRMQLLCESYTHSIKGTVNKLISIY